MTAIRVELELADGSFTTRMLHAGETIAQFNQNVARSSPQLRAMAAAGQSVITSMERANEKSQGFLGTLRDISIVVGFVGAGIGKLSNLQDTWIGKLVSTNAQFERLIFQMRSMSTASDPVKDAAKNFSALLENAKDAPFSLDALTKGFAKLKATGTDPLSGSMQSLEDGVAAFGGSNSEFERVIVAITQMSGKGVIQMEELRQQLGEAMPKAMQDMAASMGVSVAQLVQAISTGRVEAGASLDLFYKELERAYGGTSRRMMETFSGQLQRTQTQFQEFARIAGGIDANTGIAAKGGFMDQLAQGVRDFNNAMASSTGRNIARELGDGLTTLIGVIRNAVSIGWEFRDTIVAVAKAAAIIAGYRIAVGAVGSLRDAFRTARIDLRMFWSEAQAAIPSLRGLSAAMSGMGGAGLLSGRLAAGAGALLRLGSLAIRTVPMIGVFGAAVIEVANSFDLFDAKGKDALDTLEKWGEIAADRLGDAKQGLKDLYDDLAKTEAYAYARAKRSTSAAPGSKDFDDLYMQYRVEEDPQYQEKLARYFKLKQTLADAEAKLAEESGQRVSQAMLRALDDQQQQQNTAYEKRREAIQKAADDELAIAIKSKGDVAAVDAKRKKDLADNQRKFYQDQIAQLEAFKEKIAPSGEVGPLSPAQNAALAELQHRITAARENLEAVPDSLSGEPMLPKDNSAKDATKAQNMLTKTREAVAALEEQVTGADKELAKFHAELANGDFGPRSTQGVKDLETEMEGLLARKKALDDYLDGKKKLQTDLDQAETAAIEKHIELVEKAKGRELTETEKINIKIQEGYYKGFGPNSPTIQAITGTTKGLQLQGKTAEQSGLVMRENTFGNETNRTIVTTTDRLREMLNVMLQIGGALKGINFNNMGMPGSLNTFGPGTPFKFDTGSGIFELIKKVESGGDYNATLDNGMWTGGPQNLTAMTIDQILQLQQSMLANPANRAKYYGKGSSALGAYQIVGSTLARLKQQMGLSGDELFDQQMQDKMAALLLQGRSGQGIEGLRAEWEGLKNVDPATIMAALQSRKGPTVANAVVAGATSPTTVAQPTTNLPSMDQVSAESAAWQEQMAKDKAAFDAQLKKVAEMEQQNVIDGKKADVEEKTKEMAAGIDAAKQSLDGFDKQYRATLKYLEKEKIDPKTPEAQKLLELAKERDKVEKDMADRKQAQTALDSSATKLEEQKVAMAQRIADLQKKTKDPNFIPDSSELINLRKQMDEIVNNTAIVYGKDSAQYKAALQQKSSMLAEFGRQEAWEAASASAERTRQMKLSNMTESQQRQQGLQQELAAVDAWLSKSKQGNAEDVQLTAQAEAEKAAIRQKYAQQSPLGKQMQEWSDLSGNIQQNMVNFNDQLADGLASLVTGTGDLKSIVQSLIQQLISSGLKAMFARMKTGSKGAPTAPAANAGKKGASAGGKIGIFGAKHTGGIVGGNASLLRAVNPAVFAGARRFHSGSNNIGSGLRLLPGEVPIIAKKDEGIFTKEQMAALGARMQSGGNQVITISAPVSVNANGGSHEQNADLAKQVGKQIENTMRGVVVDELRKQMKSNNMLGKRIR